MQKLFVIIFICLSTVSIAQKKNLIIEGTAPDLYIAHKVTSGESFFSLGRKYNQTPQAIATYNNLVMEKGLLLGQTIKVPLTKQNLASAGEVQAGETLVPLYHIVGKSETLFRISNNMNTAVPEVKQWNNLSSDVIAAGTPLIVGHLKLANNQVATTPKSTEAATNNSTSAKVEASDVPKKPVEELKKDEPIAAATKVEEKKPEPIAPAKLEEKTPEPIAAKVEEKKEEPIVKAEEKKQEPTSLKNETTPPTGPLIQNTSTSSVSEKTPQQPAALSKEEPKKLDLLAPEPETSNEGVFSELYSSDVAEKALTNKTGEAATFKSTSGWQDKKYYVLMNSVPPGTILKIASPDNKVVFAKVLGNMPEMKENKGLLLRISNAAASYLGMADSKFPVQVTFYQ